MYKKQGDESKKNERERERERERRGEPDVLTRFSVFASEGERRRRPLFGGIAA